MATDSLHSLSVDEVLRRLGTRREGLTEEEAAERLRRYGRNEIQRRKPVSPIRLILQQFTDFFIIVLLFAAALAFAVSFVPGEADRRLTAYFILGIIGISVGLNFFEEYKAQKGLEALDKLLVFKAFVIRNGARREVDASEVVPGDILELAHGQKIPADARLIESRSLRADESALTGESVGVDKSVQPVAEDAPLAERTSMVFGSTYITQGNGTAVAVRTGMATEVGLIAATLQGMAERPTPFQVEVKKMASQMTFLVGTLALIVAFVLFFVQHQPLVDVALNTLSLAVATIPESLPIVLTFALALGAHEMAVRKAVVRRLAVVESLGSVDTICTDKTGTLTQNMMKVQRLFIDGQTSPLPDGRAVEGTLLELLRAGILCNDAVVEDPETFRLAGDPVDTAMLRVAKLAGMDIENVREQCPKVSEIPFSSQTKMMVTVNQCDHLFVAYAKGAPEAVLARCATVLRNGETVPLDQDLRESVETSLHQLESEAWYVLALARKEVDSGEANDEASQGMILIGFQAMMDPPRPGAAESIAQAHGAGIRVIMITGDNSLTARAVGAQLGIGTRAAEASEIDRLSDDELTQRVAEIDIVARATPETKQRILSGLQQAGHIVAMTGDGVNDTTALKQSDVGVAMGLRGTDIAKESSAMVLLDDNFATIIAAVEEGRRIFDNIRKFTNYLLSTSLGEVFVVLAISIAGYFPLSAVMLLWINVVTDLVPASALAADPAVPQVMTRRPRRHSEPILNKAIYVTIAGSVFRTLIAYAFVFYMGLSFGGVTYARTMLFTVIVLHAFTRVLVVRQLDNLSLWSNPAVLWSYMGALGLQMLALYTPLRELFRVVPLDWRAWAVMVPVTAISSLAGVYMTRWLLRLVPLWQE